MARLGRPRAFDREAALHTAMLVFWERGYEATSTTELSAAIGINPPSLYAAFTNKENLFREAIGHYEATEAAVSRQAMNAAPDVRSAVAALLHGSVDQFTADGKPHGCMIVQAAANCTADHESVRDFALRCRARTKSVIKERLERAVAEGELAAEVDTERIAAFYTTFLNGVSVQARDGAPRAQLHALVDMAMAAWDASLAAPSAVGPATA
ncbi:TetR/AcrR family transcriptional regulator [Actinacidiphila guanduensis]|uniref:Transcriptional regulator, TetR family n=1 Tax=Actinacidiphila guanduensis TaxID=310781 RepID=A0A1G9UXR8_9ACTN|nr:TetR/AcrR family transcriptional regulator [Actinacidiphila guanduensis]SDM64445.1 transcriptional regulator, TetR family [Actinacidiphila guanduensis]